jgi:hypothetical protein
MPYVPIRIRPLVIDLPSCHLEEQGRGMEQPAGAVGVAYGLEADAGTVCGMCSGCAVSSPQKRDGTLPCAHCGAPLRGRRPQSRYCSTRCRRAACRTRQQATPAYWLARIEEATARLKTLCLTRPR